MEVRQNPLGSAPLGKLLVKFAVPSGKRLKVNAAQAVNIKKAGKRKMEEMGLNDKTVQRLREYLLAEGWTAEKILDLFDYLTK